MSVACAGGERGARRLKNAAASHYTRALALGAADGAAFSARGISRFYLGKYQEAQADFLQSFAAKRDDAAVAVYSILWHGLASLRMSQPQGAELLALAKDVDGSAAWPRPLLALLSGQLGEQALLDAVLRKQGDDRDMALTKHGSSSAS